MTSKHLTRRTFLMGSLTLAAAGATSNELKDAPARAPRIISPNEKLNIAAIGAGGRGNAILRGTVRDTENCVALCDVDWERAAGAFQQFPEARKYKDYREMLDKEANNIDAVTIGTPDHMHAHQALAAMELGKHVYVEKPLTHNIFEARTLLEAARRYNVQTQMGNQGHSGDGVREMCEIVWSGIAGDITEVHIWTNRPVWPQGIPEPLPAQPVPETLDWDLWIGCAPMRPYNPDYAPFKWRGWWDFGAGALGDMGCHIMDPAFWALDLSNPISVECIYQKDKNDQTAPSQSIVKYEFPERFNTFARRLMCPVSVYWYEGGLLPTRPAEVPLDEQLGEGNNGSLFIGTREILTTGTYGGGTRVLPAKRHEELEEFLSEIPETIERVPVSHQENWVQACKGEGTPVSDFEYSVPLTETVLLGNLAMRSGQKVYWDAANMQVTNEIPGVEEYVRRTYRRGWDLV